MKKNIFNTVKLSKPGRSVFDLSHDVKQSMTFGKLYPTLVLETVPGDSFNISSEHMIRFAPMLAPIMHRIDAFMHYFFVPNRLVWDGWQDFITQTPVYPGTLPADIPVHPFITIPDTATPFELKPLTYFGVGGNPNQTITNDFTINPLAISAYWLIFNEYYRDQNLEENFYKEAQHLDDGDNSAKNAALLGLATRAWEHDYFTSALPFAQKGTQVDIPLGTVELIPQLDYAALAENPIFRSKVTGVPLSGDLQAEDTGDPSIIALPGPTAAIYDPQGTLTVGSTTINDLRRAFRLQEWYERQARGGTRYIESILAHFGVRSSDARLQRPEYIGGSKSPVSISEVLSTNGNEADGNLGDMGGHGISVSNGNPANFFCEEHGHIIGIMSIRPRTAYINQVHKQWYKGISNDPFEYYWPEFANIGEQEILNKELNHQHLVPEGTFGYIPRYAEYKYLNSRVAGDFGDSLQFWHLGIDTGDTIALADAFVKCEPRTDIFAVNDGTDYLWAHIYHKIRAKRPMPYFGTPTI